MTMELLALGHLDEVYSDPDHIKRAIAHRYSIR